MTYLRANRGDTRYLVATTNAIAASPLILAMRESVMALGGFLGTDSILTPTKLASVVENNTVRHFLLFSAPDEAADPFANGGPFSIGSGGELGMWVEQHCAVVPIERWQAPGSAAGAVPFPFDPPIGGVLGLLGGPPPLPGEL